MKRIISLVAVVVLYSNLMSTLDRPYAATEARGVTQDLIRIGVMIDLTGPTSNVGVVVMEAYKNFVRHINDGGGVHGRKIKLIVEDDRYSIPAGIAAFKKLLFRDQVMSILGPISVGEIRVLFRHIEKHKIPTLPWAPDRSVMIPYKRYIFPTNGFYADEFGIIFDYILNEVKAVNPKIALGYPDVESGKLLRDHALSWAEHFGLKLHLEVIPLGAIDVTSQVLSMKRSGISHVLLAHVAPGAAAVLKDMKKFGFQIPSYGISAACTEDVIRIGGNATKNFVGTSHYSSWYEESPGMRKLRKISLRYNPDADNSYRIKSYSFGWVVSVILHEGLKRAGRELDGEKFVTALETLRELDTAGLCGPITYTPRLHSGLKYIRLFKTDPGRGELVPITDWKLPPSRE